MKLVKKLFFILIIAVIAVLISYFAKMNDTYVTLNLFFVEIKEIQLWLLSLFSFLFGVIFSVVAVFIDFMFASGKEKKLEKEVAKLKSELVTLRSERFANIEDETFAKDPDSAVVEPETK